MEKKPIGRPELSEDEKLVGFRVSLKQKHVNKLGGEKRCQELARELLTNKAQE